MRPSFLFKLNRTLAMSSIARYQPAAPTPRLSSPQSYPLVVPGYLYEKA